MLCLNCSYFGCIGCNNQACLCNQSCIRCWEYQNISTGCFIQRYPNSNTDFRIRYLCLHCNKCWKEKYDKYTKKLSSFRVQLKRISDSEYSELKSIGKQVKKYSMDYKKRCTCGYVPIVIGDKFRPPKQTDKKAWEKIKNLSEYDKNKLLGYFCPYYVYDRTKSKTKDFTFKTGIPETADILKHKYG